jgi:hypothetical protein
MSRGELCNLASANGMSICRDSIVSRMLKLSSLVRSRLRYACPISTMVIDDCISYVREDMRDRPSRQACTLYSIRSFCVLSSKSKDDQK